MRAASVRKAVLHGPKKDLDVDKYAAEPQDEYQIVVQSQDMAPFVRHDEKFFEANAFLESRKSKRKLPPSHVRYERDEKGVLVTAAIFYFPKKTPSGDPPSRATKGTSTSTARLKVLSIPVENSPLYRSKIPHP